MTSINFKEAMFEESMIPKFVWDFAKRHTGSIVLAGILAMVIWGFMKKHRSKIKENIESKPGQDLSTFLNNNKHKYKRGSCPKAADKVVSLNDNYKILHLNNPPINEDKLDIGAHIVATNGDLIIDLTAPDYIKHFINKNQATSWHIKNKDNVKFRADDYKNNMFKPKTEGNNNA